MDTGYLSGRSALPAPTPSISILARPGRGDPPAHLSRADGRLPSQEGGGAPSPLFVGPGGRPGAVQQLAEFLSSLLQKLQRKLPTPLVLPGLGLRQRPPARRPNSSPAAQPLSCSYILPSSRGETHSFLSGRGGLRAPSLSQGPGGGPPAARSLASPCAPRSTLSTAASQPGSPPRRRAPECARVPPRLAASRPPGASPSR